MTEAKLPPESELIIAAHWYAAGTPGGFDRLLEVKDQAVEGELHNELKAAVGRAIADRIMAARRRESTAEIDRVHRKEIGDLIIKIGEALQKARRERPRGYRPPVELPDDKPAPTPSYLDQRPPDPYRDRLWDLENRPRAT